MKSLGELWLRAKLDLHKDKNPPTLETVDPVMLYAACSDVLRELNRLRKERISTNGESGSKPNEE